MPATGDGQTSTGGQRGHGRGRPRSEAARHGPDAAALAREAVIAFLQAASKATAEREAEQAVAAPGAEATSAAERAEIDAALGPEAMPSPGAGSEAWNLRTMSSAALDRIEAAAAAVEADIAVAHRSYEQLQAGAGAAAEAAVRAAESAMASAGTAVEAERKVRISLRQVRQTVVITTVLAAVIIIALLLLATVVH